MAKVTSELAGIYVNACIDTARPGASRGRRGQSAGTRIPRLSPVRLDVHARVRYGFPTTRTNPRRPYAGAREMRNLAGRECNRAPWHAARRTRAKVAMIVALLPVRAALDIRSAPAA